MSKLTLVLMILLGLMVSITVYLETKKPEVTLPYELIEWTDGTCAKSCIWINGQTYYGDTVENIAGDNPRFIIRREDAYLILPDKIIINSIE